MRSSHRFQVIGFTNVVRIVLLCTLSDMSFINDVCLGLAIVLLTIVSTDKRWCNGLNEVAYSFGYVVNESDVVAQHWEDRRSDIVRGGYSFLDADGRVRVVQYQVAGSNGFRAAVNFRKSPTSYALVGHLVFPKHFRHPLVLAEPVAVISADLFNRRRTYPNLPN